MINFLLIFYCLMGGIVLANVDPDIKEDVWYGTDEKGVQAFIYKDGCVVSNNLEEPKVLNPKECPDKGLVKMLNCNEIVGAPQSEWPEECK